MKRSKKSSSHPLRWLWAVLITLGVLWIVQQFLFKPVIESVAAKVVGARVSLGSFSINPFSQQVRLDHLQIYNEEGFPPGVFFDASEILVNADIFAVLQGKLHFPLIVFRLDKMIVYKNAQGKLNVDELKIVKEKLREKNKGPALNFRIDVLKLNIEQVVVEDESKTPPLVEVYDLNLKNKTINNIDSASKLVGVVMLEILKPTALQSAGLYAATTLLGVAFLPGLAIGVAIANDGAEAQLPHSYDQVYQHCLQLIDRLAGKIKKSDPASGYISADVYGCDIAIHIHQEGWFQSWISIKARKFFLARPEIAGGLLYQLKEGL